jgi:multicomponent Na+:H+ antiporter subunit D
MEADVSAAASGLALPPGLILIAAGFMLLWLKGLARDVVVLGAPVVALAVVWLVPEGISLTFNYLGYELALLRADALARVFGTIFTIMAFAGGLFALRQERLAEMAMAFIYAGAAVGVVFAGDLMTVFVFWEIMAFASAMVLWLAGEGARAAGFRYLTIHLLGGVVLMAGIAWHIGATGTTAFGLLTDSPAKWLIMAGFLLNAGAPPLSAWLPDAYPQASWSGTVFLSAFTTKTAVYVLMRGFAGEGLLIWVGLFMVFYGIIYAILENDMRRILAYSIINQVGFMVTGIGIGTAMALNGVASHAFVHIIYKALLLMSAGSVLFMTGKSKCTDLGGLFRTMPVTTICGIIGALSISAFPLTSGFIAKSMISEGALGEHMALVWYLLAAASAGVFLHAGIKFPWFVFFQKDSGLRPPDPPRTMQSAMILMAVICIGVGIWPDPLYAILPFPVDFVPYTGQHVVSQLQLLLFSGLAFFMMLALLRRTRTITLDADWFWRSLPAVIGRMLGGAGARISETVAANSRKTLESILRAIYRHNGPSGILGRSWPTGGMAFWATVLLGAIMILYYID